MLQIDRDALLVAVEIDEVSCFFAVEWRAPAARHVALGRLDLDHVRAVVGEHGGRKRAGEGVREVEDGHVLEGEAHYWCASSSPRSRHSVGTARNPRSSG